jgi:hypothetical protein
LKRKKRRIFASAVLAGKLLFGTPLTQEKVISNQEFNSLDGSHNSGKIIRTGNGTILEFQQEVSEANSTDTDEVILVKYDGILPGADAFPPPFPQRHGGRTTNGMGGSSPGSNSAPSSGTGNLDGNCRSNPTPRFPHQLSSNYQNQNNKKKKKKNSTQVSEERVIEAYQNFISEMNDKGYQGNISEDRFLELSTNPQTGVFDEKSIFEAEGRFARRS